MELLREAYIAEDDEGGVTDDALRKALNVHENEDKDESRDPRQFVIVTKAMRIEVGLSVFERISAARPLLKRFSKEYDLELKSTSVWNDRHTHLIVKAKASGFQCLDWREQIAARTSLTERAESHPDII